MSGLVGGELARCERRGGGGSGGGRHGRFACGRHASAQKFSSVSVADVQTHREPIWHDLVVCRLKCASTRPPKSPTATPPHHRRRASSSTCSARAFSTENALRKRRSARCAPARRGGALASNELRSAASTLTFGVVSLRGRLQHLLPADDAAPPRARHACLAAAYLLHERRGRATRTIGPEALGLDGRTLRALRTADVRRLAGLDVAARYSLPAPLVDAWSAQLPPDEVEALAATCNVPGPVTLRANVARTSAAALAAALRRRGFACATDGALSPWAVAVRGGRADWPCSLWSLNEWQDGSFEVQDEGSQFVALATEAAPGERVLDLCAGNGGKSVAIAGMVGDSGHVFAYDVEVKRLEQLRAAAVRAGVEDRVTALGSAAAVAAHAPYDVVLVDAPRARARAQFGATRDCAGRGRRAAMRASMRLAAGAPPRPPIFRRCSARSARRRCRSRGPTAAASSTRRARSSASRTTTSPTPSRRRVGWGVAL